MVSSFQAALEERVAALRAHPKVTVHLFEINPPASAADIEAAEEAVKRRLPDDMRAFYLAHDGAILSWGIAGRTYDSSLETYGYPDYGAPPGIINLLPARQVFSPGWVMDGTVNYTSDVPVTLFGVADEDEDDDRVRAAVVDNFSRFHHADVVFGPADRPPRILIADDHGAELFESNLSSFTTYLDITLALWGTGRMRAYKVARYRKPLEITEPKVRPTLDEIVAEAERD